MALIITAPSVPHAMQAEIESRDFVQPLTDGMALAIAAMWQSPGSIGSALAAFASGVSVPVSDVLDDITATIKHDVPSLEGTRDLLALYAWIVAQAQAEPLSLPAEYSMVGATDPKWAARLAREASSAT